MKMSSSTARWAAVTAVAAVALVLGLGRGSSDSAPVVAIQTAAARPVPGGTGPVSYADAVQQAAPAVVKIDTAKVVEVHRHPLFNDPMFRELFGDMIQGGEVSRRRIPGLGSGVIVSDQGYVLTNNHVIRDADEITVSLQDGRMAPARIVGTDPETDLAVLKIDLPRLPAITFGSAEDLRVGDVVLAIGNPFGVGQTVTMGIVSATGRTSLGINLFENFIQTDAAINPGNSGGALVDAYGNLVGINSAIFSNSGGSMGIGFAIPVSMARNVMEQIIAHGHPLRGWLGFEGRDLTPDLAAAVGVNQAEGVIVTRVLRGGPAHVAGLIPGDVLVAVDNREMRTAHDAEAAILAHKPGDSIELRVVREGRKMTLHALAAQRPANPPRRTTG